MRARSTASTMSAVVKRIVCKSLRQTDDRAAGEISAQAG
jgi:hypothetical protein